MSGCLDNNVYSRFKLSRSAKGALVGLGGYVMPKCKVFEVSASRNPTSNGF